MTCQSKNYHSQTGSGIFSKFKSNKKNTSQRIQTMNTHIDLDEQIKQLKRTLRNTKDEQQKLTIKSQLAQLEQQKQQALEEIQKDLLEYVGLL